MSHKIEEEAVCQHVDEQIQWRHLDPIKFLSLNVVLHAAMDVFLYPPDVVRTRMQVQVLVRCDPFETQQAVVVNAVGAGQKDLCLSFPTYKNTWDCFKTIVAQEGTRGLYKGFLIAETSYVAATLFHYAGYEIIKEKLQQAVGGNASQHKGHLAWTAFTAGAVADAASLTFLVPAEVVQQRLQIQGPFGAKTYKGGVDAVTQIARNEGLRGLYRGTGATFLVYAPASAIWWTAYELFKSAMCTVDLRSPFGLRPYKGGATGGSLQDEDPVMHGLAGAIASAITRVLMNPIDIAKTRLQTQDVYAVKGPVNRTTVGILLHMLKHEGISSAFKGLLPALMSSVPSGVASISIYEWVKKQSLKHEYQGKNGFQSYKS